MLKVASPNKDQINFQKKLEAQSQIELQNNFYNQLSTLAAKYNEIFVTYLSSLQSLPLESDEEFKKSVEQEIKNLEASKKNFEDFFNGLEKFRIFNDQTEYKFRASKEEIQSLLELTTLANDHLNSLPLCKNFLASNNNSQTSEYQFNKEAYTIALNNYQNSVQTLPEKFKHKQIAILEAEKNIYNRKAEHYRGETVLSLGVLLFSGLLTAAGIGLIFAGLSWTVIGIFGIPEVSLPGAFIAFAGGFTALAGAAGMLSSIGGLLVCPLGFFFNKASAKGIENKINDLHAAEKMQVNQDVQETEDINLLVNTL